MSPNVKSHLSSFCHPLSKDDLTDLFSRFINTLVCVTLTLTPTDIYRCTQHTDDASYSFDFAIKFKSPINKHSLILITYTYWWLYRL